MGCPSEQFTRNLTLFIERKGSEEFKALVMINKVRSDDLKRLYSFRIKGEHLKDHLSLRDA
jgi:hypothetical protein